MNQVALCRITVVETTMPGVEQGAEWWEVISAYHHYRFQNEARAREVADQLRRHELVVFSAADVLNRYPTDGAYGR